MIRLIKSVFEKGMKNHPFFINFLSSETPDRSAVAVAGRGRWTTFWWRKWSYRSLVFRTVIIVVIISSVAFGISVNACIIITVRWIIRISFRWSKYPSDHVTNSATPYRCCRFGGWTPHRYGSTWLRNSIRPKISANTWITGMIISVQIILSRSPVCIYTSTG